MAQSIDDFLDQHRTNQYAKQIWKAAIVKTILECEAQSSLFFADADADDQFDQLRFKTRGSPNSCLCCAGASLRKTSRGFFDRVSFIVFNYDRCIEHFLVNALQRVYDVRESRILDLMVKLQIIHPYGKSAPYVPFGSASGDYATLANGIKTYTEQLEDPKIIEGLQNLMDEAEQIIFLGFAYHDQNMALIKPIDGIMSAKPVFGTSLGMSDSDVQVTAREIAGWFGMETAALHPNPDVHLQSLRCDALFGYYAKTFSAELVDFRRDLTRDFH